MALTRRISRLAKILVEGEGIDFETAEARLRALTLEIDVGRNATTQAAHAAILTAVSAGGRTFLGGVRVVGACEQPLNTALPLRGPTLRDAVSALGASPFEGTALCRIAIGDADTGVGGSVIRPWWASWRAGISRVSHPIFALDDNPLAGIAAGALGVGAAFQVARGVECEAETELDLWGRANSGEARPLFSEIYLPKALWLIGLGNLGQAYLWTLAALPYAKPAEVQLVLQDRDVITEENWATSVLVHDECYGDLKTEIGEAWAKAKGFSVRRLDRRLLLGDRLDDDDPRVALSAVDKNEARRFMANTGFSCIVDSGLGRRASDFDRYRVTVFDHDHPIDKHFEGMEDKVARPVPVIAEDAYNRLEQEIGRCGAAELAGASAAIPYVSAIAASCAVSRLLRLTSGLDCPQSEVAFVSRMSQRRITDTVAFDTRAISRAGRPQD
jgi:hypothetical protein